MAADSGTARRLAVAALVGGGSLDGQRFPLAQDITLIGRADDCDVCVQDPLASRHHAQVKRETWRYVLQDLESRNGTLVNGEPVSGDHHLQHGDTIHVATTPLRFEDPNATVPMARLPVWVNAATGEAFAFGTRLELAPKELTLLSLLYEKGGEICDKDEIARTVWPEYEGAVSDYNIETLVSRLRAKLEAGGAGGDTIITVKKRGYRLRGAER
jgi:hypothetical protein